MQKNTIRMSRDAASLTMQKSAEKWLEICLNWQDAVKL